METTIKPGAGFLHPGKDLPTELFRDPSVERKGRTDKRGRASKPKVKSGCITCKTRRVKCDETKPECLRCQKFGRPCDGYAPEQSRPRSLSQIRPRSSSTPIYSPSLSIHESEAESRYFQVFAERTVYEIPGFFVGTPSSTFWTRIVLQESHNVHAIRHAAIALGALSKSLDEASTPYLKVNVVEHVSGRHHQFAVHQHIKAIKALNQYISSTSSPQLRNALIACVLFVCFEASQGSKSSCAQQTQAGLKMLRGYYTRKLRTGSTTPPQSGSNQQKAPLHQGQFPQYSHAQIPSDSLGEEVTALHDDYSDAEPWVQHHAPSMPFSSPSVNIISPEMSPGFMTFSPTRGFASPQNLMSTEENREAQNMISMYSPQDYLNALPSNAPGPNWETGSDYISAPTHLSTSAVSTPLPETPPSRSSSIPLPTPPLPSLAQGRPLLSRVTTPPLLQNDIPIEDIVIQTVARLNGQGFFLGATAYAPPLVWDMDNVHRVPIPSVFPNFHVAHLCWDFLMDRALQFVRLAIYNRLYSPASSDPPEIIAQQIMYWQNELAAFEVAFRPIIDSAILPDGTVANPAALTISVYQKCISIALTVTTDDSEILYDYCLPHFQYIVHTCGILASLRDTAGIPRMPRFSFDVGIVPALHLTATKCRDPIIRREAVDLLYSSPRHEGMWDSFLCARIGRWIIACEEEGLDLSGLPVRESKMPGLWGPQFQEERFHYPVPDYILGASPPEPSSWDSGLPISQNPDRMTTIGIKEFASVNDGGHLVNSFDIPPHMGLETDVQRGAGREPMPLNTMPFVPERNRVQLRGVDFHVPDRYIKASCQRAMPRDNGMREERQTVLPW